MGIGRLVAKLWGFCGLAEAPDFPGRPDSGASGSCNLCMLVIILRVTQRGRDSLPAKGDSAPAGARRSRTTSPSVPAAPISAVPARILAPARRERDEPGRGRPLPGSQRQRFTDLRLQRDDLGQRHDGSGYEHISGQIRPTTRAPSATTTWAAWRSSVVPYGHGGPRPWGRGSTVQRFSDPDMPDVVCTGIRQSQLNGA